MKLAKDVHRVYGLVVLPNPRGSEKLHEKLGFHVNTGLLHEGGYKFDANRVRSFYDA